MPPEFVQFFRHDATTPGLDEFRRDTPEQIRRQIETTQLFQPDNLSQHTTQSY